MCLCRWCIVFGIILYISSFNLYINFGNIKYKYHFCQLNIYSGSTITPPEITEHMIPLSDGPGVLLYFTTITSPYLHVNIMIMYLLFLNLGKEISMCTNILIVWIILRVLLLSWVSGVICSKVSHAWQTSCAVCCVITKRLRYAVYIMGARWGKR